MCKINCVIICRQLSGKQSYQLFCFMKNVTTFSNDHEELVSVRNSIYHDDLVGEDLFKEMMMMMMNRDLDLCQGLLFQGLGQAIQRLSRRPLGVTTTPRNPKFHLCSKQSLPAMV